MSHQPPPGVVALPREVLHLLLDLPGEADMETLRAVGDAGGAGLLEAFARWSGDGYAEDLGDLPAEAFGQRAAEFFSWCGLGDASVFTRSDSLIEVSLELAEAPCGPIGMKRPRDVAAGILSSSTP